jgi:glycerophosphoryl diester phosphodiesterase
MAAHPALALLDPTRRLVIAHRGASAEAPENTLESFRLGLEQGADALELDVRLSADGIPVVIHDPTIDRTTNGTGEVAGLSLEALQCADAGGARIPTLREVLEAFPTIPILLEVKAAEAQAAVATEIDRAGARERIVIASFQHRAMEQLRDGPYLIGADRRDVTALSLLRSPVAMEGEARSAEAVVHRSREAAEPTGACVDCR